MGIRCPHMPEGTFSHGAAHLLFLVTLNLLFHISNIRIMIYSYIFSEYKIHLISDQLEKIIN